MRRGPPFQSRQDPSAICIIDELTGCGSRASQSAIQMASSNNRLVAMRRLPISRGHPLNFSCKKGHVTLRLLNGGPFLKKMIKAQRLRVLALLLRDQGETFSVIGKALGVHRARAERITKHAQGLRATQQVFGNVPRRVCIILIRAGFRTREEVEKAVASGRPDLLTLRNCGPALAAYIRQEFAHQPKEAKVRTRRHPSRRRQTLKSSPQRIVPKPSEI